MKFLGQGRSAESYRPERESEVREHLANERALLAWVRTGVGLISVGFVVERVGALAAGTPGGQETALASEIFGLALVARCLTLVMGAMQFFRNRRMIIAGVFSATSTPYIVIVAGSLLLAEAFIVYTIL